ncbi:macro domain-containing protein [Corallococcus exiguus]|uniref:macro domain-containing protein n=1 Tax=Corallococcus exiguus TaxID=83462 RepID=UPI003DA63DF5
MPVQLVEGDLLDQPVDAIVNAWNRNIIPWWLLLPQGVSGAIKRRGGTAPFREVARVGPMPLGSAVVTGAGRLPFKGIIHVAGIDMLWRASALYGNDHEPDAVLLQLFLLRLSLLIGGRFNLGFIRAEQWMRLVRHYKQTGRDVGPSVRRQNAHGHLNPVITRPGEHEIPEGMDRMLNRRRIATCSRAEMELRERFLELFA